MAFKNRNHAAEMLIPSLKKYGNENSIVLAVPRGGVPIAYLIAKAYHMPLDLLMTKKIGYPSHPEFAIGAVNPEDYIIDEQSNVLQSYIKDQVEKIQKALKDKYRQYTQGSPPCAMENKTVIIVDDGMATGYTILSAIGMLKKKKPSKIVVAVPVAPFETIEIIRPQVDDLICLWAPDPFTSVGQHYEDFTQVSDQQVMQLLRSARDFAFDPKKNKNEPQ